MENLGTSAYARILTVREFQVEYTNSSVGKFCSCDFDAIGSGWYQHENICIDGDNNVKYLNSSADVYTKQAQDLGLSHAQGPLLPAPLSWEDRNLDAKVQVLHGRIILLHCWRSPGHNPIHFVFGFGGFFRRYYRLHFLVIISHRVSPVLTSTLTISFTHFWMYFYRRLREAYNHYQTTFMLFQIFLE